MVAMSAPWCHWKLLAVRAKLITDIRMQATGPCDRTDLCHITWCMTVQVSRDSATASAGADAHSQSPASVKRDEVVLQSSRRLRGVIGRGFKAVLCESPRTTSGVGIIVSERFRDPIVSVERFDDRLMKIVVAAKERLYHFFSAYAPQTGCSDQAKD
ncbi:unnamed protein product [Heligmosomoides polygyrus]|uniref:Uncharacterized protein n=1 Tax=Heligmosomoides polygyrus TaxID=6339 RepID=A0A183GF09_HELPZ|nr:unnamed protein product [Heligmosomoides polygyrus]